MSEIGQDEHSHSQSAHLVRMANDIGNFFKGAPDRDAAIAGISNHIRSFWTARMKSKIIAHLHHTGPASGEPLDELPREAIRRLAEEPEAKPAQAPGGDAG